DLRGGRPVTKELKPNLLEGKTADDFLETAEAVIREMGREDFVYEPPDPYAGCLYCDPETGDPSCLIGHVLHRWGVLEYAEEEMDALFVLEEQLGCADAELSNLAQEMQSMQDEGRTWGG